MSLRRYGCHLSTAVIALAALYLPAARGQWGILQNGGFEDSTTDMAPWQSEGTSPCGLDSDPASGQDFPEQGTVNAYIPAASALYQTVNTTQGAVYHLSFWAYCETSPGPSNLQVGFDPEGVLPWGANQAVMITISNGTLASGPYGNFSLNLTAVDKSAFLSFSYDPASGVSHARLDNVSLSLAALPAGAGGGRGASTGTIVGAAVGCAVAGLLLGVVVALTAWKKTGKAWPTAWNTRKGQHGKVDGGSQGWQPTSPSKANQLASLAMPSVHSEYYSAASSKHPAAPHLAPASRHQGQTRIAVPPAPVVQGDLRLFARSPDVYSEYHGT